MSPTTIALLEKVLTLGVGLAFGMMGYRLFHAGLYEHADQVKASSAESSVLLKQILPGLVFSLFAGVIVVAGLRQSATPGREPSGPQTTIEVLPPPDLSPDIEFEIEVPANPLEGPIGPESDSRYHFPEAGSGLMAPEAGSRLLLPEAGSRL